MTSTQQLPWLSRFARSLSVCSALIAAAGAVNAQTMPSIQFNQVGYLTAGAKWAAVSAATPAVGAEFSVVDAKTGQVVFKGNLGAAAEWPLSKEAVRLADFSGLQTPGSYRLRVAGVPDSAPFSIAGNSYEAVTRAGIRAYFLNRASIELKPEHAGEFARPAAHPDTVVRIHASAVGPKRKEGDLISSPKGWYDAGDYNKYIVNSGITVYTLLAAYEHHPEHFKRLALNIPESGNGLPDLLNEVLWNLDWMLTMQDPDDGGVYHKLTDLRFDGMQLPHHSKAERYVVMKGTAATLDFAAVMAQASRVFKAFEAQRPGLSARTLEAAKRAWDWAKAHPDVRYRQPADVRTGAYGDEDLRDELAWAAAELFVTTGDASYLSAASSYGQAPMLVPSWNQVGALGWMTLAHHRKLLPETPGPFSLAKAVPAKITALAQELADDWQTSPYRTTLRRSDFVWGSNAVVLNQAMMLLQGYELTGERRMLDAAQAALDYVLGRNATNLSQVTGLGSNPAKNPHHRPSAGYGKAVPGFLVGGPNPNMQDRAQCPPYPSTEVAKAYLDHVCSYASNEIAINWNAPLVYVSAALEALTPPPAKK